jgi:hypothetical protein
VLESKALEQERFDAALDLLKHRYPGERFAVRKALAAVLKPRLRRPRATPLTATEGPGLAPGPLIKSPTRVKNLMLAHIGAVTTLQTAED